jgi:hypothetical protein
LQLELQPEQPQAQVQKEEEGGKQKELRRKTSAEMNMKSHVFGYDVEEGSGSEGEEVGLHKKFVAGGFGGKRRSDSLKREEGGGSGSGSGGLKRGEVLGSGSERGQGSSQFFPGSGFF